MYHLSVEESPIETSPTTVPWYSKSGQFLLYSFATVVSRIEARQRSPGTRVILGEQVVGGAALLLQEAYDSSFQHQFKKKGSGMTPRKPDNPEAGGANDDIPPNDEKPSDEEIQTALANIRKAHGEYER